MIKLPTISTYYGGKGSSGTCQTIINHIRPHDTLVIPFLGNCALTRQIQWPAQVIANDLDPYIIDQWRNAQLGPRLDLYNLPALDFLATVLKRPNLGRVVIYCDPPYPLDSRKSQQPRYSFEMTDHEEFLTAVRFLRVDCLVSTYPNERYAQHLSHWNRTEFQSQTRHGAATEWLFYNCSKPEVLHDARFAGNDYREREYIKRKAARWATKWKQLQPHERQHILQELVQQTRPELLTMASTAAVGGAAK
ncbi:MAG: DNA adenine methylase [Glaciimonas sp.]|nr:DNA adenine methylase [Glaciimonas sp.]